MFGSRIHRMVKLGLSIDEDDEVEVSRLTPPNPPPCAHQELGDAYVVSSQLGRGHVVRYSVVRLPLSQSEGLRMV